MRNITYINAGAGSGKTHTLTHLLADALRNKEVLPEQVIMTTFTKKAAGEFKEKTKRVLFEKGLFQEATLLDGALIGTIHSVANTMISKFWYYLGLSPEAKIMSEDDEKVYRDRSLGTLPSSDELQFLHRFTEYFSIQTYATLDYDFWHSHLNAIIALTTNYDIKDYTLSREKSKELCLSWVKPDATLPDKKLISEALDALEDIYTELGDDKSKETVVNLKTSLHNIDFKLLKDLNTLVNGKTKKFKNKAENSVALTEIKDKLALMWNTPEVYSMVERYIDVMFNLAHRWKEMYAAYKKENGILDYNDIEKYLLKLLQDPYVADQIGKQYRYIYVDEFQDCSPIQVKIFSALADHAAKSFWVGDLKQSIYGFRGSDPALIKAVITSIRESGNGCNEKTLDTSYRSVPGIVNFCNKIFIKAFETELKEMEISLLPNKKPDPDIEPLAVWNVPIIKGDNGEKISPKQQIADRIVNLINNGVAPAEITVLARANKYLEEIGSDLKERGIPVNLETGSLMDSKATILLKALLNLTENRNDSLAKAEIAFLVDDRYKDIGNLISDTLEHIPSDSCFPDHSFLDEKVELIKTLNGLRDRLEYLSIAEKVETLILALNLFEEVGKCCQQKEGINVLNAIIREAKAYDEASVNLGTQPTTKGFIDYLSKDSVKIPGDADGVVLQTMHGSKGLQNKYVIISSLEANPAEEMKIIKQDIFGVHFHRTHPSTPENLFPEVYITLLPFIYGQGNTKVPEKIVEELQTGYPEYSDICQASIAESKRLLYVALTRPTHQLILTLEKEKNPLQWLKDIGLSEIKDEAGNVFPLSTPDGLTRFILSLT